MIFTMSYKQFKERYPLYSIPIFENDDNYVVKFALNAQGDIAFLEVGYKNDDWSL